MFKKLIQGLFWVSLAGLLAGCSSRPIVQQEQSYISARVTATSLPSVTFILTPTQIPPATATFTLIPTSTPPPPSSSKPSSTPTHTPTPSPSPSFTPTPLLP